jgi:predicted CopG family antitoxin
MSLLTYPQLIRKLHVQKRRRFPLQKKLTITVDEAVYKGLHKNIGPRKISKFVEELVRPHVVRPNLELAYSQMSKDKKREAEALKWAEATLVDNGKQAATV